MDILISYACLLIGLAISYIIYRGLRVLFSQVLVIQFCTFLIMILGSLKISKYYHLPPVQEMVKPAVVQPLFTIFSFYLIVNILRESIQLKPSLKLIKFSLWSFLIPFFTGIGVGFYLLSGFQYIISFGLIFSMIAIPILYIYLKDLNYSQGRINAYLQSAILIDLTIWCIFSLININQSFYFILIPVLLGITPVILKSMPSWYVNLLLLIFYFILQYYKMNTILFCLIYLFFMKKNQQKNFFTYNFKYRNFIKTHVIIPATIFFGLLQINFNAIKGINLPYIFLLIVLPNLSKIIGNMLSFWVIKKHTNLFDSILLNTRGLTEIIFLNLLYSLHYINDILYFYFMVMGLTSTLLPGLLIEIKNKLNIHKNKTSLS